MSGFIIRDKDLNIKASVTGQRATVLIGGVKGKWDSIKFKGEERQQCFIISEGTAFTNESGWHGSDSMTIFITEGDYLLPIK